MRCKGLGYGFCSDFLVKSGLIHRCLQFNQAEISGYWHPSGADMPLSGDLGNILLWTVRFSRIVTSGAGMVFLCINALDHNCTILHRISHRLFSVFQLNFNDLAFIDGNELVVIFDI